MDAFAVGYDLGLRAKVGRWPVVVCVHRRIDDDPHVNDSFSYFINIFCVVYSTELKFCIYEINTVQ